MIPFWIMKCFCKFNVLCLWWISWIIFVSLLCYYIHNLHQLISIFEASFQWKMKIEIVFLYRIKVFFEQLNLRGKCSIHVLRTKFLRDTSSQFKLMEKYIRNRKSMYTNILKQPNLNIISLSYDDILNVFWSIRYANVFVIKLSKFWFNEFSLNILNNFPILVF